MSAPSRILLLQLKRIGDTILTAPAVAAVRARFPDAALTLVVEQPAREIAGCIGAATEVRAFRRGRVNAGLLAHIAGGRFDTVLDFTGNDRSAFLTLLARGYRRITYTRHWTGAFRGRLYTGFVEVPVRDLHTIDYHLGLLAPLGIEAAPPTLALEPGPAARAAASALIGDDPDFFLLHPGTARPEKYWKPERWAAVADRCAERTGWRCVLTGTRDPFEQRHLAEIRARLRCPVLDLSGATRLPVLLALLGRARLLLGVDSAPMHLAAAARTPQVALFGPTNPFHWRPLDPRAITLQAGNPESDFTDPRRPGAPMDGIETEAVLAALEQALRLAVGAGRAVR